MSETLDLNELDSADGLDRLREAAKQSIADKAVAAPRVVKRTFIPRELAFPVELRDPYTNEVVRTFRVTSKVMDGPESAQTIRYAAALAGVPMDTLSAEDAGWFKALARCETQVRAVAGTGFEPDVASSPEKRLRAFFKLLWEDPELLAHVNGRCLDHEARFRIGEPPEGQSTPRFPRVVVPPLDVAKLASTSG